MIYWYLNLSGFPFIVQVMVTPEQALQENIPHKDQQNLMQFPKCNHETIRPIDSYGLIILFNWFFFFKFKVLIYVDNNG